MRRRFTDGTRAPGNDLVANGLRGVGTRLPSIIIASATMLATPALAQQKPTLAQEKTQVTGIVEAGSYLCDLAQGGGINCQPTPLLPCGSPVPMRGGSETMAHVYCESLISERVQDDPERNIFPRRNAIVSCMTKWRKSNEVGLAASASPQDKAQIDQEKLPSTEYNSNDTKLTSPKAQYNLSITPQNHDIIQRIPDITGVVEAGSYFCEVLKSGVIDCRPNPVLSCGTSKHLSIESEAEARQNCEDLVPQRIQDDPGKNIFPRRTAVAGCLTRWRMSKKHLLMPGN